MCCAASALARRRDAARRRARIAATMDDESEEEEAPLMRPPKRRLPPHGDAISMDWHCVRPLLRLMAVAFLVYSLIVHCLRPSSHMEYGGRHGHEDERPSQVQLNRNASVNDTAASAATMRDLALGTCDRCTAPDDELFQTAVVKQSRSPAEAEAARVAQAASNAAAAVSLRKRVPSSGHVPVGQRMRVKWADERHLGTVYDHKHQRDPITGRMALATCVAYDADPVGLRPCHDLNVVEFQLVASGVFEISPPPPGGQRLATTLRSCCHEGGAWDQQCGGGRAHTWDEGVRVCNRAKCPRCGVVKVGNGAVDRNCCNHGGSWFSHCGPPEEGWAFSWQEGFRICRNGSGTTHPAHWAGSRASSELPRNPDRYV